MLARCGYFPGYQRGRGRGREREREGENVVADEVAVSTYPAWGFFLTSPCRSVLFCCALLFLSPVLEDGGGLVAVVAVVWALFAAEALVGRGGVVGEPGEDALCGVGAAIGGIAARSIVVAHSHGPLRASWFARA